MSEFIVRKAVRADVPQMMQLVKELAVYEKAGNQVTNTEQQMVQDGFGDNPIFEALVAEKDALIVGISIYYFRYSTWKGKRLYLEDIVVNKEQRKKGIGKLLMDKTIEIAKQSNCSGMMWQVLDWNELAINFYKKYNANFDNEWINVSLEFK